MIYIQQSFIIRNYINLGDDLTENKRKLIKLYLPTTNMQQNTKLISFLDIFFPKSMSSITLKSYHFKHDGFSHGTTTYHLSLKHYKKLLQTASFVQQEQYFMQAEKKDYYFDCLVVRPFMIFSFILPDDIFLQNKLQIISFCQDTLLQQEGYCAFVADIKTEEKNTVLSYKEQQYLKYFLPIVSHSEIIHEILSFYFSAKKQYEYFLFNNCLLPHFNDSYMNPTFYEKQFFGQNFTQIRKYNFIHYQSEPLIDYF